MFASIKPQVTDLCFVGVVEDSVKVYSLSFA